MWVLFRLEKEEREPSDSFGNGKGIAIYKDGSNHTYYHLSVMGISLSLSQNDPIGFNCIFISKIVIFIFYFYHLEFFNFFL
jgi:hypothetical protein